MLPQTLHGRPAVALLLPVTAPLEQALLRGSLRWDNAALWFEWYSGGFPIPANLTRLEREFLVLTPEVRTELLQQKLTSEAQTALANADYLVSCCVTSVPDDAIPVPGLVAVADSPNPARAVDPERWRRR